MDLHHQRHLVDAGDRRDVAEKIEIELIVKRHVYRGRCVDHQQSVAVRRRVRDRSGADRAASTRPGFNDDLLAEPLRQ